MVWAPLEQAAEAGKPCAAPWVERHKPTIRSVEWLELDGCLVALAPTLVISVVALAVDITEVLFRVHLLVDEWHVLAVRVAAQEVIREVACRALLILG